ncbi:hypothetical protein ACWGHU_10025 [Streptomyces xanthophaeus]
MAVRPEIDPVVYIGGQLDPEFEYQRGQSRSSVEASTASEAEAQEGVNTAPIEEGLDLVIDAPEGFNKLAGTNGRSTMMDQGQS